MATANYIQKGDIIAFENQTDTTIKYNQLVLMTDIIGVAVADIPAGNIGSVRIDGAFSIKAETTAEFTMGQVIYFDSTQNLATATATDNQKLGVAIATKATAENTALIKIN